MSSQPPSGSVEQQAQDTAERLAHEARQLSSDMVQQAQGAAKSTAGQQKGRAADAVGSVAQALHQTSQSLQQQQQDTLSRALKQTADRLDQISNDLQNKSVDEIVGEVEDFARRDPQLFLGGAVVLGLLTARFLKSSGQRQMRYSQGSTAYRRAPQRRGYYTDQDLSDYRREALNEEYGAGYPATGYSAPGSVQDSTTYPSETRPESDFAPDESTSRPSNLSRGNEGNLPPNTDITRRDNE